MRVNFFACCASVEEKVIHNKLITNQKRDFDRIVFVSVSLLTADNCLLATYNCHLITRSARTSTLGGIVRPICLAAFKLTINSNFVGCSTGRSAGLAPFRILSTYVAAR